MKTSQTGIEMIKKYEGVRLQAYKAIPTELHYTIGYGHYGADVSPDMKITKKQAEELLKSDLEKFEGYVNQIGLELSQPQFDALVSFAYNCGVGNLRKLVLNRTLQEIADHITLYNKAGGRVLAGLTKRREEEKALFLSTSVIVPKVSTVDTEHGKIVETVAREVVKGLWGVGQDRVNKLKAAGHDPREIQKRVNEIIKEGR